MLLCHRHFTKTRHQRHAWSSLHRGCSWSRFHWSAFNIIDNWVVIFNFDDWSILNNWEVIRYLSTAVPWPYPDDGALCYIRDVLLPGAKKGDLMTWSINLKETPFTAIGIPRFFRACCK